MWKTGSKYTIKPKRPSHSILSSGLSLVKVGEIVGASAKTVRTRLYEHGVVSRPRAGRRSRTPRSSSPRGSAPGASVLPGLFFPRRPADLTGTCPMPGMYTQSAFKHGEPPIPAGGIVIYSAATSHPSAVSGHLVPAPPRTGSRWCGTCGDHHHVERSSAQS